MVFGIIFGIIFAVACIGCIIWATNAWDNDSYGSMTAGIVVAIICALLFLTIPFSIHTVDTGEVAVVKHLGEAKEVRTAGTHFDFWMTESYMRYDAKVQNVEITTAAYSSDAQTMDIVMTLQYQIMSDKVLEIAKEYGSLEVLQNRIQSIAIEKSKSVLSSYKAMDIIADRSSMSPEVEQAIKDAISDKYYVTISAVVLTNIDFTDAFEKAVEDKMIAEQAKLKAEYENETKVAQAKAEAEAKVESAKAQIEIAKAEAEALKIAAEAEAEANEIIAKSLTNEIINKILADAWNGELPDVVGSGNYILPTDIFNK